MLVVLLTLSPAGGFRRRQLAEFYGWAVCQNLRKTVPKRPHAYSSQELKGERESLLVELAGAAECRPACGSHPTQQH